MDALLKRINTDFNLIAAVFPQEYGVEYTKKPTPRNENCFSYTNNQFIDSIYYNIIGSNRHMEQDNPRYSAFMPFTTLTTDSDLFLKAVAPNERDSERGSESNHPWNLYITFKGVLKPTSWTISNKAQRHQGAVSTVELHKMDGTLVSTHTFSSRDLVATIELPADTEFNHGLYLVLSGAFDSETSWPEGSNKSKQSFISHASFSGEFIPD